MPVYNAGKYLKDAIESILNQSFSEFELLIINDGSVDGSHDIIRSFNDSRIVYIRHEVNQGLVAALNTGLEAATGKYIARMDQDDIALAHRLEKQIAYMEKDPSCILLGTQVQVLGETKTSAMYGDNDQLRTALLFGTSFAHPTVMMRSSSLRENNIRYEEEFKHAEDYRLWTRLTSYGKIANLKDICLYYRRHPTQYSKVFSEQMRLITRDIRKSYLESLGIELSGCEMETLHRIAAKEFDHPSKDQLSEAGKLLNKLSSYLSHAGINRTLADRILYRIWKQLCGERQKRGYRSYQLFRSYGQGSSRYDIKVYLWFLLRSLKSNKKQ